MIFILSIIKVCSNCFFTKLEDALKFSKPRDTIIVYNGKYILNELIINKPLTLLGDNGPIISGNGKYEMLIIMSDSVIIKGFRFENSGYGFNKDFSALRIKNCKGCIIENNVFINNMWSIYVENSQNVVIRNNYINGGKEDSSGTYSGNGIHLWYCKNIIIENNEITGHRDGIYFEFVDSSIIRNNKSYKNARYGLHFMYSNNNKFFENVFYKNGAIAVMYSKGTIIYRNIIKEHIGSSGYGILLKDIYDSEINSNFIYRNTIGLLFDNANNLKIQNNIFLENGIAINLFGSSSNNEFFRNDFIGNIFDVSTNSFYANAFFNENYYDTYNGYDINKDGFGDVPHRIIKLFSVLINLHPSLYLLLRSPLENILDSIEKAFPVIIPSILEDKKPKMKPINYGKDRKFKQEI